jgi:hypothetical protein
MARLAATPYLRAFGTVTGTLLVASLIASTPMAGRAAAYEGFDYPVGAMPANSSAGNGFLAGWSYTNGVAPGVVAGSLSDPTGTLLTSGNHVAAPGYFEMVRQAREKPSQTGGEFWVSFLMRRTGEQRGWSGVLMRTGGAEDDYFIGEPGGGPGENSLVISNGSDPAAAVSGVPFETGRTYFLVARFQVGAGNDPGTLWVDPTPGVMPTTAGTTFTLGNFGGNAPIMDFQAVPFGTTTTEFDEIRTGFSYADVAPVVRSRGRRGWRSARSSSSAGYDAEVNPRGRGTAARPPPGRSS